MQKMDMSMDVTEKHALRHMAIVGGELDDQGRLCENDRQYRYAFLKVLKRIGIPFDPSFTPYMEYDNRSVGPNTDIINIQERWGGRDFLKTETSTDILVFANVSYSLSSNYDFFASLRQKLCRTAFEESILLRNTVSDQNRNDRLWYEKVRESGAKMIAIVGACDYPGKKLAGNDFIILRNLMVGFNDVLLHRDYIRAIKPHLIASKSPLEEVARLATSVTDIVEFRRDELEMKFEPVWPDFESEPVPHRARGGFNPRP